jgi:metacaspase-1
MHSIMVKPLPAGCRLTALYDCCHSGSALDLPYIYVLLAYFTANYQGSNGLVKEPNLLHEAAHGLLGAGLSYQRGDVEGVITAGSSLFKKLTTTEEKRQSNRETKTSPADVIQLSGCKDYETSKDTMEGVIIHQRRC